jgi:hypothetical protein
MSRSVSTSCGTTEKSDRGGSVVINGDTRFIARPPQPSVESVCVGDGSVVAGGAGWVGSLAAALVVDPLDFCCCCGRRFIAIRFFSAVVSLTTHRIVSAISFSLPLPSIHSGFGPYLWHVTVRLLQVKHTGFPSSHFFLRRRQVQHPFVLLVRLDMLVGSLPADRCELSLGRAPNFRQYLCPKFV